MNILTVPSYYSRRHLSMPTITFRLCDDDDEGHQQKKSSPPSSSNEDGKTSKTTTRKKKNILPKSSSDEMGVYGRTTRDPLIFKIVNIESLFVKNLKYATNFGYILSPVYHFLRKKQPFNCMD